MDSQLDVLPNKGPCCDARAWLPLIVALATVAGSLGLTWGLELKACPLCLYQRAFAMGTAAVLLMGVALRADSRLLGLLALPLVAAGLKVAAFHVYLEAIGKLECPAGFFAIGSAPQQALAGFVLLLLSLVPALAGKGVACCRTSALLGGLVLGGLLGYACVKSAPPPQLPKAPYSAPPDGCRPPYVAPAAVSDEAPAERQVVLRFPEDRSFGLLRVRAPLPPGDPIFDDQWTFFAEARGAVEVPSDKLVRLDLSQAALSDPSPLSRLPPDALHVLLAAATPADDRFVEHIAHLSGLRVLMLTHCPVTDAGVERLRGLSALEHLFLDGTDITDKTLAQLVAWPGLRRLSLRHTSITNEGLRQVGRMTELRSLVLSNNQIGDDGIRHLANLQKVTWLNVSEIPLSDAAMDTIAGLKSLETLFVRETLLTDAGISHLARLPALRELWASGNNVSGAWFAAFRDSSPLEILHCGDRTTDEGLARIGALSNLKKLHAISAIAVTDAGVEQLARLARLEELRLSVTEDVTDTGIAAVCRIKTLKSLQLHGARVSDEGLRRLAELPLLERLILSLSDVSYDVLRHLQGCRNLSDLRMSGSRFTGTPTLRHLAPLSNLSWLALPDAPFAANEFAHLAGLKRLERLEITGPIDDAGLAHLAGLTGLVQLDIAQGGFTDDGLRHLAGMRHLEQLQLIGTYTDFGLDHLWSFPRLSYLNLQSPTLSEDALDELRSRLPALQTLTSPQNPFHGLDHVRISMVGQPAPDFEVATLDGQTFRMREQRGRIVVLHVWGTWCKPCVRHLPDIKNLHAELLAEHDDLTMLSLSLDDDAAAAREVIQRHGLDWPQAIVGSTSPIPADYHLPGAGALLVISPQGTIIADDGGWDDVRAAVELAAAERP